MRTLALLVPLLFAQPAFAQAVEGPAARRHLLELRAELEAIDTEGPDFAVEVGAHLVAIGVAYTLLGSVIELISQEISARWRFQDPPWFLIGGAAIGAVLGAVGTPLLVWGMSDGGRRRRSELEEEIGRLEATLASLVVRPATDGVLIELGVRF